MPTCLEWHNGNILTWNWRYGTKRDDFVSTLCLTLGKKLHLFEAPFSCLKNNDNNISLFPETPWSPSSIWIAASHHSGTSFTVTNFQGLKKLEIITCYTLSSADLQTLALTIPADSSGIFLEDFRTNPREDKPSLSSIFISLADKHFYVTGICSKHLTNDNWFNSMSLMPPLEIWPGVLVYLRTSSSL